MHSVSFAVGLLATSAVKDLPLDSIEGEGRKAKIDLSSRGLANLLRILQRGYIRVWSRVL